MKSIRNLVVTALVGMFLVVCTGGAKADSHMGDGRTVWSQLGASRGNWLYRWVCPGYDGFYTGYGNQPDVGVDWQKDFDGEVRYIDQYHMVIAAEGSGDLMHFDLYPGTTSYTPSWDGVRVGSHVKVRSDDWHRVRWVTVIPFYKWLASQTK